MLKRREKNLESEIQKLKTELILGFGFSPSKKCDLEEDKFQAEKELEIIKIALYGIPLPDSEKNNATQTEPASPDDSSEVEYMSSNNITHEIKNITKLEYPDKVTFDWIKAHVPIPIWSWFFGLLFAAFSLGMLLGQSDLYRNFNQSTKPSSIINKQKAILPNVIKKQ